MATADRQTWMKANPWVKCDSCTSEGMVPTVDAEGNRWMEYCECKRVWKTKLRMAVGSVTVNDSKKRAAGER